MKLSRLLPLTLIILSSILAFGQRDGAAPFSPLEVHDVDAIDLMTLTPTLNIPIQRKIGAIPVNYTATLSQLCTVNVPGGNYAAGHIYCGQNTGYLSGLAGATVTETNTSTYCSGGYHPVYSKFMVTNGLDVHPLSTSLTLSPVCSGTSSFTNQVTIDGSGYTVSVNVSGSTITYTITDSRGHTASSTQETDTFGNTLTYNGQGGLVDSLGVTTLTGISVPAYAVVPGTAYGWTDTNGNPQQISFPAGTQLTNSTNWTCVQNQNTGAFTPFGSIQYPDNTSIGLAYEQGPGGAGTTTGRISQITLRSGGTITYTYGPFYCGYDQPPGPVYVSSLTRTTYDGTNSYSTSYSSAANPNNTTGTITTVLDPGKNKTVYTFSGSNGYLSNLPQAAVITEVQVYQNTGTVSSPTYTLLSTDLYCYNGNQSNCANAAVNYPITQRDVYHTLGTGSTARTTTVLDTYGNVTSTTNYGFNSTYVTKTTNTYSGCGQGSTVHSLPCDSLTVDNAGNHLSEVKYTYNSAGFKLSDSSWTGSQWITNTYTPNANGTAATATNANGAVTTFGYANGCNNLLQTSASTTISSSDVITTSQTWNCNGAVVTGTTDANGNTTSSTYDSMFRVATLTDVLGNVTTYTRTATTTESAMPFNSGNATVDVLTSYDGLGRDILDQRKQSPTSSQWDTVSKSYSYVGPNQTAEVSVPYSGTGRIITSSNLSVSTVDPLGRVMSLVGGYPANGAGESVQNTYKNNDTSVSIGPPPTGEGYKTVQTETDGLGRVTSVCIVTSSGGANCGQAIGGSGILTTTSYVSGPGATGSWTVTQTRGSQSKVTVYDPLGRVNSRTLPESGTITNVYDTIGRDDCNNGSRASYGDLLQTTFADGNYLCFVYDSTHRLTDVGNSYPSGETYYCKRFRYDNSQGVLGTIPSGVTVANSYGHVVEAETDNCPSTITQANIITDEWFSYDAAGNITDVWEYTPHLGSYVHTGTPRYTNGALGYLQLPDYPGVGLSIDGEGRPYWLGFGGVSVSSVQYNASSQPATITYGNGDVDSYNYDPYTSWLDSFSFAVNGSAYTGTLGWNSNGSLGSLSISDGLNSGGTQSCTFAYDDAARLTSDNCGSLWSQTFSYDQYNNLTKSGSLTWNPSYNSSNNHYSGIGATYDANGRILYDGFNTYTWDVYGKMSSARSGSGQAVCGSTGSCITYDALGRAVEVSKNSTYSEYVYSGVGLVATMNGASTVTQGRIPMPGGGVLLTTGTNGTGSQIIEHHDWLGSVRLATYYSRRASVYDQAFAPYGEVYDAIGTAVPVFTGDRQDLFAGLYDTPNREMMPNQGRWLSPDPAGASWNAYAYPTDPNTQVDPSGSYAVSYSVGDLYGCNAFSVSCGPSLSGFEETDEGEEDASGMKARLAEYNTAQAAQQTQVASPAPCGVGIGAGSNGGCGLPPGPGGVYATYRTDALAFSFDSDIGVRGLTSVAGGILSLPVDLMCRGDARCEKDMYLAGQIAPMPMAFEMGEGATLVGPVSVETPEIMLATMDGSITGKWSTFTFPSNDFWASEYAANWVKLYQENPASLEGNIGHGDITPMELGPALLGRMDTFNWYQRALAILQKYYPIIP